MTETIASATYSCGSKATVTTYDTACTIDFDDPFLDRLYGRGVFGLGIVCAEQVQDADLGGYNGACIHTSALAS